MALLEMVQDVKLSRGKVKRLVPCANLSASKMDFNFS